MTTSPYRPFMVLVACAALGLSLAAHAQTTPVTTVTAPAGGMMASGAPFTVQWTSPGQGTIYIELVPASAVNPIANLASGIANTGQTQVSLPATVECDPQQFYKLRVTRYYSTNNNYYHYNITGESAQFKFTCPITVIKQVVNTTGRHVFGSVFRVRVECEPGSQTFGNIQAPGPGSFTQKVHVSPNSTWCTVQEVSAPSPAVGCAWQTTYPGGQQRAPGGAPVTIVNTLQCGPLPPPPGPR